MHLRRLFCCLALTLMPVLAFAQQTGEIRGRVTASDGSALPGVTVEAQSNVLPQARVTTTDMNGDYRLPALQPGTYTLTFNLSGMQTATRRAAVQLSQATTADVTLGVQGVTETVTVTASATLVDRRSTEIESGISNNEIQALPVTQNYGDLQKLIPGVMYNPDAVRGPSAGASGQENVYQYDGANITMPLFGVLNVQPNTRDIAQVTITKGGASATQFNRAGGFLIDTVSKAGTNKFMGEIGYQVLNHSFIADQVGTSNLVYAQDRSWGNANIGGPILPDRMFFYGSYYRPNYKRSNQSNLYGDLPSYSRKRNEYFGKLTVTPTSAWLINGTYRKSRDTETSGEFSSLQAPTTGTGYETDLKLATLETSWIINSKSFATAKFNDFKNPGGGKADFISNAVVSTQLGTQLDLQNLAQQGRLILPLPLGNNAAQNAFIAPFINQYGYICPSGATNCTPGARTGGGTVGFGQFAANDDSFFRKTFQGQYNLTLGNRITHDLHAGYQNSLDEEDRFQTSNGWGAITIPAGVAPAGTCPASACGSATPAFFVASFPQQTGGLAPVIHSEVRIQNFEINDAIRFNDWTFNVGVMASNDKLYGQGLAKADNLAGFVSSPGTKYLMHEFGWDEMIQPRLGATWAYNSKDTVWASYARYHPQANSDARAASWDRNLATTINAYFDAQGKLIGVAPVAGSSGKWWQEGVKPPQINEFLVGTARQFTPRWSARFYGRGRKGKNYLEDTNNDARSNPTYNAPADIAAKGLYVPNLTAIRTAIGRGSLSGSTYVIANLDGAFTKYYEATLENEWRGDALTINGSYTWSHFYGNFDQDNTSFNTANDAALFIGSSNIADSQGRQVWDNKYGDLRGDRRHVVKVRSVYMTPWRGSVGVFGVVQSGQPYQLESVLPYRGFTTSTSDTNRYAESAGSRRSPGYYNVDLNYTQNIPLIRGINLQLAFDIFNLTDNQQGYNYETRIGSLGFTNDRNVPQVPVPLTISDAVLKAQVAPNAATFNRADWGVKAPFAKSFYAPRRFQVAARLQF